MTWSIDEEGNPDANIRVCLTKDGRDIGRDFSGDTTIEEAVTEMCRENNITSVVVKDDRGNEIPQNQGHKPLFEVGRIYLNVKYSGA